MFPVEILPVQGTLVLRARGSELLILPVHVTELKQLREPKDFTSYFMKAALINRPARKLFEAWLRKDMGLWKRIYHTIGEMPEAEAASEEAIDVAEPVKAKPSRAPASAPIEHKKEVAAVVETEDDSEEEDTKVAKSAKTTKKVAEKKAPAKKATKTGGSSVKKAAPAAAKKTATKKPTAPAKKAVPAKKPAAKKKEAGKKGK